MKSLTPHPLSTVDTPRAPLRPPPPPRHPAKGITLLAALAFLLLIAALAATLQARSLRDARLLARLTTDLQDRAARDALRDLLRSPLADALASPTPLPGRPRLDSTPFPMEWEGQSWQARVQDVEGLVDLYLASDATLAILPIDPSAVATRRAEAMSTLPPGTRFPTLSLTLANFGMDPITLAGLVTQSGSTGALRLATLPEPLRARASGILPGPREMEQVTRVTVTFEKLSP